MSRQPFQPTRRAVLGTIAGAACLPLGTAGPVAAESGMDVVPIRQVAAEAGIVFGTSIAQDALDDPALGALYVRHAALMTTDWALKLDVMRPEQDVFRTSFADQLIGFTDASGVPMRGTCLAWNDSRPKWLMPMSAKEKRYHLERHIDETAGRYAGRLQSWDVVNEPFWPDHGVAGGYRDGPWLEAFGDGYIEMAFRRAMAADPGCRLVLNEAHAEQWTERGALIRAGMLQLIDRLQDAGVRLDAVGYQGHMQPQWAYDDQGFADYLHQVAERDVEIYITELDCYDFHYPEDPLIRDAAVADRYEAFLKAVLSVPAVTTVITWQLSDGATHYRGWPQQMQETGSRRTRPLPFDSELRPKAAYDAVIAAFQARRG